MSPAAESARARSHRSHRGRRRPQPIIQDPAIRALFDQLGTVSLAMEHSLKRRLQTLSQQADPERRAAGLVAIEEDIATAQAALIARTAGIPEPTYPEHLPVSERRDDIIAAINQHQVLVVAGETGSGKTTQLPKMCLDAGRGRRATIGHTQPRRLAARTVAERVAQELSTEVGEVVGYTVRFTDTATDATAIRLMTDGILLNEIQRDRMLRTYDTIIVDEAHERSLNIDFILGYLHDLLRKRRDLSLIITSATIDPQRFATHFNDAPIIEVSGRTFPVEIRYRPLVPERWDDTPADGPGKPGPAPLDDTEVIADPADQAEAISKAVRELCAEGPGDILVFLSGEREIRDTADTLAGLIPQLPRESLSIIPLYARLSSADQYKVFTPGTGRRIVLATNIAETSLTVPGIRYVIDVGTARISRYSHRTKVQRLPIERISQASAMQRSGRCGRVADGICIRLYAEEDYETRPLFTDPEILRTSLAAVILNMAALGLGDIANFAFIDKPDAKQIRDGITVLSELGALQAKGKQDTPQLTPVGRTMARLPIDPRMARMIVEGDSRGCLHDVLVLTAALSIHDPRERPLDHQQAADQQHQRFADPHSDFMSLLGLWRYLREQQAALSSSQFRKMCHKEFLSYIRVREWQDLFAQLRKTAASVGLRTSTALAHPDAVHQALLSGLLSHVGMRDERRSEYQGARGSRFRIFPGSTLAKKSPALVMAAELVETSQLWGRTVASIEPSWVEDVGSHLLSRSYSEPHWEKKQGAVIAFERVSLMGLPIVTQRKVQYSRVDPALCRELFIRHALVEGDWTTRHAFYHHNRDLIAEVEKLEHRARRRDLLADDQTVFDFYDAVIPDDVVCARHFDSWWKKASRTDPALLTLTPEVLMRQDSETVTDSDFPLVWYQQDLEFPLTYQFEPGLAADGITVHLPLEVLNRVQENGFDWLVPGLRHELVTALLRSLPKALRKQLVPAPDTATQLLSMISPEDGPLLGVLAEVIQRLKGVSIEPDDWRLDTLDPHLQVTFSVHDGDRVVGTGTDLAVLRHTLKVDVHSVMERMSSQVMLTGLTTWPDQDIDRHVETISGPHKVQGFPAVFDEGESVGLKVFATADEQHQAMHAGVRRLLALAVPNVAKQSASRLTGNQKLAMATSPYVSLNALLDDCAAVAIEAVMHRHGGFCWDRAGFMLLVDRVKAEVDTEVGRVLDSVARALTTAREVNRDLSGQASLTLLPSLADLKTQVGTLVGARFVLRAGASYVHHLPRYLAGAQHRLSKLAQSPLRDQDMMRLVHAVMGDYERAMAKVRPDSYPSSTLQQVPWLIEEYRLSLFAQHIKTTTPVSDKRIRKLLTSAI